MNQDNNLDKTDIFQTIMLLFYWKYLKHQCTETQLPAMKNASFWCVPSALIVCLCAVYDYFWCFSIQPVCIFHHAFFVCISFIHVLCNHNGSHKVLKGSWGICESLGWLLNNKGTNYWFLCFFLHFVCKHYKQLQFYSINMIWFHIFNNACGCVRQAK